MRSNRPDFLAPRVNPRMMTLGGSGVMKITTPHDVHTRCRDWSKQFRFINYVKLIYLMALKKEKKTRRKVAQRRQRRKTKFHQTMSVDCTRGANWNLISMKRKVMPSSRFRVDCRKRKKKVNHRNARWRHDLGIASLASFVPIRNLLVLYSLHRFLEWKARKKSSRWQNEWVEKKEE